MEGFNYIGLVVNQITGCSPYTYLVEINKVYGFFSITLKEDEEQALIGARIAFNIEVEKNTISKYKILEYIQMKEEIQINEWQQGNKSKQSPYQRMVLHKEWLERQHKEVRDSIYEKYKECEDEIIEGFPKD